MDREVKIRFSAEDKVSQPAKKAEGSLRELGERAAKASEQLLSIEKAKAVFEVAKGVFEGVSAVFAGMAEHSRIMKGEFEAVGKVWGDMAGHIGDSLAKSNGFKRIIDEIVKGIKDFDGWMIKNADTVETVFVGSVAAAAQSARALLFVTKGILESVIVAKGLIESLKPKENTRMQLAAAEAAQTLWMERNEARAQSGEPMVRQKYLAELAEFEQKVREIRQRHEGSAEASVLAQLAAVERMATAADEALARVAHAGDEVEGPQQPGRASRVAKGTDKATATKPTAEPNPGENSPLEAAWVANIRTQNAAALKFETDFHTEIERLRKKDIETRKKHDEEMAQLDLERGEALHAAIMASVTEQGKAWEEMKTTGQDAYMGLAGAVGASITAVASGESSFSDAIKAQAQAVAMGVAQQATVKALWEAALAVADLAMENYKGAALHGKAAAMFAGVATVGYAAGSAMDSAGWDGGSKGSGGGGGGGGSSSRASGSAYSPKPQTQNTTIIQVFGSLIRQNELGRETTRTQGRARRSGVSR